MFLSQLENVIFETIKVVNYENYDLKNAEKKKKIVEVCQKFYDNFVDKPLNLPSWIDYPVKFVLIPIAIDFLVAQLKQKGIIEGINREVIKERAIKAGLIK